MVGRAKQLAKVFLTEENDVFHFTKHRFIIANSLNRYYIF